MTKTLTYHVQPDFKLGYRPELDGIRAIAILLVFAHHIKPKLMPGGFLGVDIFFVLSGFLITNLLMEEWRRKASISLKQFFARRALRLLPALFLYLAFFALLSVSMADAIAQNIRSGIWLSLSYVSNWLFAFGYYQTGLLGITWSLAVEEQFYLLWPPVLSALICRVRKELLVSLLASGILLVMLYRSLLLYWDASIQRLYYATDTHCDGLLVGCLLGILLSPNLVSRGAKLGTWMKGLALIATPFSIWQILTANADDRFLLYGGFTLFALGIAAILMVLLLWPPRLALHILRFPPLVWIGKISYGLYLWHYPLIFFVKFMLWRSPFPIKLLSMVLLPFAFASISYYLVERPFLQIKKRIHQRI
ncbi:MAG TPA: acyltransferase [Pyrinomonadaceae bacterium]|nr:acyltransferase [Pyrinomonadaceae bacterium]